MLFFLHWPVTRSAALIKTEQMKQFIVFVKKEFLHAFRDRRTLLILFGLPIAQIILFGFALTNELKNAKLVVMDAARDEQSMKIINQVAASPYFDIERNAYSSSQLLDAFRSGKVKAAMVFQPGFGREVLHNGNSYLQVITDGSDPNTARTINNYINSIVQAAYPAGGIQPVVHMLYNPSLSGTMNFVPGVMALILMLVCTTLTAVSIVKEKELGTMEILLVSPVRPAFVLFSKAIPYFLLSLVNLIVILLLGNYVLGVPVKGNVLLLFAVSALFIITCLAFGLFISTRASTQQAAMLVSMMGMMLPTILFTGFMFPIENMPIPLQIISNIVPSRWYYKIVQAVMLKGLGWQAIWKQTLVLLGMTIFLLGISIRNFNIRLS